MDSFLYKHGKVYFKGLDIQKTFSVSLPISMSNAVVKVKRVQCSVLFKVQETETLYTCTLSYLQLYVASRVQRNGGWTVLTFLLSWSVCAVNFFCLLNPLFFIFNTLVIKLPNATGHYTCSRVACFLDPDSCYREQHASHSYSGKWCHLNVQFNKSGYC